MKPAILALALTACASAPATREPAIAALVFAPSLAVDPGAMTRTASGLYWQDLTVGDGAVARRGRDVWVQYAGWLVDGTVVDSSDTGKPIAFRLGYRRVIDGWDEGIAGMKAGGTRKLVVPARLAYGAEAVGPVPANSVLVFTITLVRVR